MLSKSVNLKGWQFLIFIVAFVVMGTSLVVLSLAAPADRGSKSKYTSSVSMHMVADTNGDGGPNWGEQIGFNASSTYTDNNGPWLNLRCTQNGTLVYSAATGYGPNYPWPWTRTMILKSETWTSGAADCSARLYGVDFRGKEFTLATTSFFVNP